jgi:short-subunit dehydrogenase
VSKPPVLILGGRSDIGLAIAHRFAAEGHPIELAARNAAALAPEKTDLELRHRVAVGLHEYDALDPEATARLLDALPELPGIAVCAVGLLGRQDEAERDAGAARTILRTNFEGPALALAEIANRFDAHGAGVIVGISSVAGDRGRATNYVYGSAKAGFTAFLSGLRNRFGKTGVHVMTVLPGFVATKMTEGHDLPPRLTASPQQIAEAVVRAVGRRRNVIYVKPVWALVMAVIRNIPEPVFKRMRI